MPTERLLNDAAGLSRASELLARGGTVVFPTETVFGLGANALDEAAVQRIFAAKNRPGDNPLIVHIANLSRIGQVARELPPIAEALLAALSPGPLTVVVPRHPDLAPAVCAGLDTVGVRIPAHPVARDLLTATPVPIAAPSANRSGRPSPTTAAMAWDELAGRVDAILDGPSSVIGLESTIVYPKDKQLHILRPGAIGVAELAQALADAGLEAEIVAASSARPAVIRAPGSRHRHYSPQAVIRLWTEAADATVPVTTRRVALVAPSWARPLLTDRIRDLGVEVVLMGDFDNLSDYARRLYGLLREVDLANCDLGLFWLPPTGTDGLTMALRDRLWRAAGLEGEGDS